MNLAVLKSITIGMGFLIVGGLAALVYGAMNQAGKLKLEKAESAPALEAPKPFGLLELKEPAGTEILELATGDGRLFLRLGGGGKPERILVLDAKTATVLGTILPTKAAGEAAGTTPPPAESSASPK